MSRTCPLNTRYLPNLLKSRAEIKKSIKTSNKTKETRPLDRQSCVVNRPVVDAKQKLFRPDKTVILLGNTLTRST